MNKHLHRIIFNAARGMRMVVQETATSTGKGASRGTVAAVTLFGVLLAGAGRAQIVGAPNVPGHLRPTVLMAPNGVPLVNIQTPSAAGVSRNVYNQFDVMRNGAILNNSRVNVQTQLGGFVQGNPWLARGPARVILNEINSGNPTQLRGHVELGGQRAEVIIANPAGISVDGGGFINASRATLTTGVPQLNALGGLDGFLVRDGTVSIEGAGLDVSKTDYAAILARAVQVNAGIWASELQVVAGANQVSTDHGSVTPVAGNGPAPAFALDVAALGGMYAQKITLVGTEAGLGVRNAGNVGAGAGGLVVTAQGRLENTGTLEGARVQLTSGADIDNRGGTIRQASMAGLTIDSPVLSNTNAGVIGAEPLASAAGEGSTSAAFAAPASSQAPAAPGTIAAAGTIRNDGGRIYVGGPITLKTPQISNAGGTLNVATMAVTGASFSNAGGTLNVSQSFGANVGRFDNAGGKLNAGSLQIATSGDLINTDGTLTSGSDASLVVGGNADNTRGTISAMGRLMANVVKAVDNSAGTLVANEGLVLDAGMLNNSGAIRAGNDVGLAVAGALVNDGGITAGRNAVITAGSLASGNASALGAGVQDDGKLIGAGNLDVTVSGMLAANGTNLASGNATLQGSSVDLSGSQTSAANIAVTATSGNVNTGDKAKVVTPGSLSITANARAGQTLANDAGTLDAGLLKLQVLNITNTRGGEIVQTASDATTVAVSGVLNNDGGRIAGNSRDLTLRAARLGNARGTIQHAGSGTLNIAGGDYDGAGGRIATNGALVAGMSRAFNHDGGTTNARRITIEAGALSNRKGQIVQGGTDATRITVTGALDNTAGTIASNGDTVVRAVSLANQGGTVRSTGAAQLSITTTADLDNSSKGTISAGERVVVQAGRLDNSGGSITATQDLSVDAPDVKNTGGLIRAGGTARLNAKKIVNTETRGNELGIEGKNLAMKVETLDNSTGAIRAGQNATLVSGGTVDNTEGLMSAAGLLTIQDPNAGNPAGRTLVITNTRGSLQGGTAAVRNPNGTVKTPGVGGIRLHAKQLVNDGPLASANDLDIALSADAVNNAVISASGNLSYTTLGTLTNKGKLLAGGTANVGGTVVDNTVTGEISGGQGALVNASNTLNNRGLIDSQGLTAANKRHTQINAGTLNNIGTGRIYGDRISIAVGTLNNTTETVEGARSNASIASRGDLDIGASTLGNREGSYIFSLQQMAIGETLDADRRATGKGGTLDNLSASIESVGDMKIGMAQVNNLNKHLVVAQRQTVGELQLSITPPGGVEAPLNTIVKDPNDRHVWRINADGTRTYLGKGWTENYYRETTTTDYLASSDPARIVSGGNMAVDGLLRNHDSQVLAGGTITTTQPADNYETPGRQVTQATGYKIVIGVRTDGKDDHNEPYIRAPKVEVVKVSPWRYQERVNEANGTEPKRGQPMATGQGPGGTGAVNPGRPGGITEVPSAKGDTLTNEAGATRTVPVVVRTSIPDAAVPAASLFGVRRDPGSNYLVETDPRFTSYRKWLGSDYLLNNLGQDPHSTLKRLGDGFYEQKLIREQVAQLTGYRYLDGFGNDEEQYTALMNGGATFAKQFNIRPGIGLSAAQMAQLTSDIVWLVEQAVTLPDGTTQQVLVPQVYVRVRPGDIEGSGALISGNAVVMKERGDLRNTGTLDAGSDIRIRGSAINAQGDLALKAREGNVSVEAARATVAVDSASEGSTKGFLSSKTTTQRDSLREDTAVGSTLGGRNVIVSGRDVTVSGSEIIADENMAIVARRDLTIEAARNTRSESSYRGSGKSGLMGSGGFGFTIGSRSQSTDTQSDSTSAVRSTVGSIGGNTTLLAGNRYTQIGSDVVAPEGDVTIAAKSIAIREARETSRTESEQKQKSGGLTIALTAPVISAVQSIGNTAKAVQQTGSGRMQALGAASMAAEAKGVADALANASVTNPAQSMGVNLSISLGGSQNRSNRTETSDTAAGSRIEGKNVSLLALGGGKDSNILVQGSDIVARDTATLVADNRIDVLAAQNTSERRGTNQGSGGSVGVSFGTSGLLFNIGANGSKGKSDGTDTEKLVGDVQAQTQITQTFGPAASKAVGDYASKQTGAYELAQLKASLAQKVLNDPNASDDQKAQASTDLANANGTLAAEKQNYENWKEGGTSRTWAHALMGGLAGNLQGAAGAALASTAAPVIDDLTRNLPDAVKGAVGAGLAAGFGAAGGGAAGAVAGFNEDFNNRQLHPLESAAIYDYARKLAARGAKDDSGKSLSANEWEQRLGRQALSETDSGFREYGTDQVAQRHLEELRGGLGTTFVDAQGRTQRFFQAQNEAEYNNHAINAGLLNESKWLYDKVGAPGVRPGTTAYLYALQAAAASDIGNLKKEPNGVKQGLFTALKDEYLASGKAMTPELMRSDPTKAARLESQQQALGNTLLRMVVDQGVDFLGVEDKKWYDVNIRTPALASIGGVGWGLGKIRAAGINGKKSPERAADGGKVGISATDGTATSPYGSSATNYGTATYADTKGQPLPSNIKNGLNYEVTTKSPFNTPSETIISPEMEVKILYGERVVNSSGAMTNRLIGAHGGDIGNGSKNYAVEIISTNPDGTRNAKLLMQFDDGALSKIKSSTLFPEGWDSKRTMEAVLKTANTQPIATRSDGGALYQSVVGGVKIEVIKVGGNVTAAYPCGKGCTSPSAFESQ